MVGIWLEFGRNDSESESNLGGLSLTSHSYQIPTIPTIPLGFRSEFGRIRSECVGESKVLSRCHHDHGCHVGTEGKDDEQWAQTTCWLGPIEICFFLFVIHFTNSLYICIHHHHER